MPDEYARGLKLAMRKESEVSRAEEGFQEYETDNHAKSIPQRGAERLEI